MRIIEIPPNPSPLIESLRDLGYSMGTALADLIDNSITAGAKSVRIFSDPPADSPMIGILDDGVGMSKTVLIEAMRLGTRSPLEVRDQSDLGRFGLGLKTASFSQCRKLSVVSRAGGVTSCAQWDLDHVARSKRWEMRIPDDPSAIPWSEHLGAHGTLVVWEHFGLGDGGDADDYGPAHLVRELDEARTHLELVFHRFLSGERGRPKINMELNNRPLEPFDPFHTGHSATQRGPLEIMKVGNQTVRIEPFTLPHHASVSQAEWDHYGGAEGYVRNQGFYVYRERRLIIYGTWFGLARQTELTKLARVRVDIPNSLDKPWKIDVRKASAQLPPSVRDRLRRIIERLGTPSKRVYTSRGRRLANEDRVPVWSRVQNQNQIFYSINTEHPAVASLLAKLEGEDRQDLLRILEVSAAALPLDALFADFGDNANGLANSSVSDGALSYAAVSTFEQLTKLGRLKDEALEIMKVAEPFRSNWDRTQLIIDENTTGDKGND